MMKTNLAKKMIARANADALPAEHDLRKLALEFENAAKGYYTKPQTVSADSFLGTFARAWKSWSAYSGESFL